MLSSFGNIRLQYRITSLVRNISNGSNDRILSLDSKLILIVISINLIYANTGLSVIPGSRKTRKRVGRGVGSGMGKTSSHGHQFSRSTPRQFEGGQTAFWKRMPKSGFNNVK